MRPSVAFFAMSMLAACGGLAYVHATRAPAQEGRSAVGPGSGSVAAPSTMVVPPSANPTGPSEGKTSKPINLATPETIAQWIKDTQSHDAETRATAIAALADAPKSQALPALQRVLEFGEPDVDRHIALRSMHALALREGDTSGQIRDVMRHAIYHGDDDAVTQTAQSLLDDIEAEFASREHPND